MAILQNQDSIDRIVLTRLSGPGKDFSSEFVNGSFNSLSLNVGKFFAGGVFNNLSHFRGKNRLTGRLKRRPQMRN